MKRLLLVIGLVCSIVTVDAVTNQLKAQQVGGGLIFGTEIESLGLKADGVYHINEQFSGQADISFFFPNEIGPGVDQTMWAINLNGQYRFDLEDAPVNVYGLAGLNFATISVDFSNQFGSGSTSSTEVGLNLGGGAEYPLDFGNIFSELKYTISDFDKLVLAAGVRIPIGQ